MAKLHPRASGIRAVVWLALATSLVWPLLASAWSRKKAAPHEPPPVRSTVPPAFTIPIEPLGFSPPGEYYLGMRNSLVSLDFLDENHLLFTFRVPGLLHREPKSGDDPSRERKIRALVLQLPQGTVQTEAVWTLHDRRRYLWMVGNGQFLLRDRNELRLGDAQLQLKPFLRFPGPVLWVEMDPERKYVITGSSEPPASASTGDEMPGPSSPGAVASVVSDQSRPSNDPDLILRILRRDSGQVMLVSHVKSVVHVPINEDGFVETLRGNGRTWVLSLSHFDGGSTIVGNVESVCSPMIDFVSPRVFLTTTCGSDGGPGVVAMTTGGRRLWENSGSGSLVWPALTVGGGGLRIARETLVVDHAVNAFSPLGTEDIKGQDVQVFDTATGKLVLRAQASPVFDAGGNMAISPNGKRVAIVMAEGIQVFDLPAPPAVPEDTLKPAKP